jgi:hypothetical protein
MASDGADEFVWPAVHQVIYAHQDLCGLAIPVDG